jgi:DNA-binding response OmpR family regulator
LLYRLWANFQRDSHCNAFNIPWIAVSDVLLSSFCNEVGHELYEMDVAVRNALLNQLKADSRFGINLVGAVVRTLTSSLSGRTMITVPSPIALGQSRHHQAASREFTPRGAGYEPASLALASAHILIIETSIPLTQRLELALTEQGCRVSIAHDGISGLILARNANPDLIVLDDILPDLSALEICRRLRSPQPQIPIIVVTEKTDIGDRLSYLDAGATDYMAKPLNTEDLSTKIRFYLCQKMTQENTLRFESLTLNRVTREVYKGQIPIRLTFKEFELLEYLMLHPHQVLHRDQIMQNVWNHSAIQNTNVLDVYI